MSAMMSAASNKINIQLFNGKIRSILNDKYNFMSTIYHEGGIGGHLGLPNASHATIYKNQMQHSSFLNTTLDYKMLMIKNYKSYGGK